MLLQRVPMPRLLAIIFGSSFLLNLSFGTYRSVFNNFAGQELGITYAQFGLLEGIREVPGLLTVVLVAFAVRMRDERLYALSGAFIGLGIGLYTIARDYSDLILATVVWSIGFHMWDVVQDSMIIRTVKQGERAGRLGQITSVAAMATLLGMGVVMVSGRWLGPSLRPFFLMAGIAGLAGALLALLMKPDLSVARRARFVFRWQYRSYYILMLLSGARRHIVLTFAGFSLVKLYGFPAQTMALLLAVHSFISIWTRPLIGRIIDRIGEQRALSLSYATVAVIFAAYAFIRQPWIIAGLFVLDNVLVGFSIAVSTYAGRVIPKEELSSSLATGSSINHIFGVMVPVVGGFLWEWFGPVYPFLMGASLAFIAMAYSWNLDARTAAANLATAHD